MKHIFVGILCLAVTASVAAQSTSGTGSPRPPQPRQPPQQTSSATMDRAALEQAIILTEQKLNEAVAKNNLAAFKTMVADTGWSLDAGGPMSVIEFEKNFAQIKIEPGWAISDSKIVWSDTNTAVHFYKWTGTGTFMGQPVPPVTFCSTVWNKRQGKWVAVFHQESAAAPGK